MSVGGVIVGLMAFAAGAFYAAISIRAWRAARAANSGVSGENIVLASRLFFSFVCVVAGGTLFTLTDGKVSGVARGLTLLVAAVWLPFAVGALIYAWWRQRRRN